MSDADLKKVFEEYQGYFSDYYAAIEPHLDDAAKAKEEGKKFIAAKESNIKALGKKLSTAGYSEDQQELVTELQQDLSSEIEGIVEKIQSKNPTAARELIEQLNSINTKFERAAAEDVVEKSGMKGQMAEEGKKFIKQQFEEMKDMYKMMPPDQLDTALDAMLESYMGDDKEAFKQELKDMLK